ncbi:MAG: T9SS type A sorting domain-containing protein [Bacteroidales bacterium]|nr:MAG: T9SS type A sorting domain-containing protein [Bacteroidales bacterium]
MYGIYILIPDNSKKYIDTGDLGFDKPGEFYRYYKDISTPIGKDEPGYSTGYRFYEFNKAKRRSKRFKSTLDVYPWVQRGPGNVGGRTRGLIVDPDDNTNKTWYAGSASGGIWKTADAGLTWINMTEDFPNLATSTITMAESNHNVIYAGTGEGFYGWGMVAGNGIFKSTDRGSTWTHLDSTILNKDFQYVNKIIVDPDNENIVIAGTNTGIFKSTDGGQTWEEVYNEGYDVQDLIANPEDFNILYAAANSLGILKSEDAGETWFHSYSGIGEGNRFHLAVSPVNPDKIYTSVEAFDLQEAGSSRYKTHIYVSFNSGQNWSRYVSPNNFLGEQGWFNNIIEVHPFDDNIVYVGGVNMGKIEFKSGLSTSEPQVMRVDTAGTAVFMRFVNFGGDYLGGGMATGDQEDGKELLSSDWVSAEIRFGPGRQQKAHRFTVPEGEGAGVPYEDYTYRDYINVPFEAWDTENNRQLMVSFRDQERDGEFNLIERDIDDDISGREYIFVNAAEYNENAPHSKIALDGGYTYKLLYFVWPYLPTDSTWTPDALPESKIIVQYGTFSLVNEESASTVLADSRKNKDLHVDHHEILTIVTSEENEEFTILEANDGGLGISYDEGKTWEQLKNGYITTQFYGVAKKPGSHEYIGGMQDNGTWQSPGGVSANSTSEYDDKIGGDGFEALWHPLYPHRIIGSAYYNRFYVSNDAGETWKRAFNGINDDGPFISRLSHSRTKPDVLFAVGSDGVYRHKNFGMGRYDWQLIRIKDGWSANDYVTSAHNVEVSLATDTIVWAGAGMYADPDLHVFVSTNGGSSFDSVSNYLDAELGYISGIATHPVDPYTAYILFSYEEKPKILRTTNLGEEWEDISGFGDKDSSDNGFPDVMVYSLLVMPYNTNIIWAGTEIGLFESVDNGETWYYADNGLPAVSIWQMFIQDNHIIVATHGRGIWSLDLNMVDIEDKILDNNTEIRLYPNPSNGVFNISIDNNYFGELQFKIFDINGREVLNHKRIKAAENYKISLDLSNLKNGTYILHTLMGNKTATNKIIITH